MEEERFGSYGSGERLSPLSSETISDNEMTPEDIECENVNFGEFQRKDSIDYEIQLARRKEGVTHGARGDSHEPTLQLIEVIKEDETEEDDEEEQEMVSSSVWDAPGKVFIYCGALAARCRACLCSPVRLCLCDSKQFGESCG